MRDYSAEVFEASEYARTEADLGKVVDYLRGLIGDGGSEVVEVRRPSGIGETGTVYLYPEGRSDARLIGCGFEVER